DRAALGIRAAAVRVRWTARYSLAAVAGVCAVGDPLCRCSIAAPDKHRASRAPRQSLPLVAERLARADRTAGALSGCRTLRALARGRRGAARRAAGAVDAPPASRNGERPGTHRRR